MGDKNYLIDLSTECSDFKCPELLNELAAKYIEEGDNCFSGSDGYLPLREKISEFSQSNYNSYFNPQTEITITPGTVQTISSLINTFVNEQDEVILLEPGNKLYIPAIKINGGTPVFISYKLPDFQIDWEEVRKIITSKTRMIILNTPHSATGKVFSKDDLFQLQHLIQGTKIIVVSDERFEHLIYDNQQHQSVAKYNQLKINSFVVSSFGSILNINGWCIGWCIAPEYLMSQFREVNRFQNFSVNAPLQKALAEYLKIQDNFSEITEIYQGKRNYFNRLMKDLPLKIIPSQGSYFQLLDFSSFTNKPDIEIVNDLRDNYRVSVTPLSSFTTHLNKLSFLRICFAKKNETIELAVENLKKYFM